MNDEIGAGRVPRPLAAAFVASAALSVLSWVACSPRPPAPGSDPWRMLAEALGPERPFEPLVTGMPYGPFRPARSSAPAPAPSTDLRLAAALIEKAADRSPARSKQAAVARLLLGDSDGAVSLLEQAVSRASADGRLRADLAGAYLVRAERAGRYDDLARALDSGERAVRIDPTIPEAWFNLALARERLHLVRDAVRAWRAPALAAGPWLNEARSRADQAAESTREARRGPLAARMEDGAARIDSRTIAADPDLVGELLERHVLDQWAAAVLAADRKREAAFAERAREIAAELYRVTHDRFHRSLVAALVDAPPALTAGYAGGWRHHVEGLRARDDNRMQAAREASAHADTAFGLEPSTVNAARIILASGLDRLGGRREQAVARLRQFERYCASQEFAGVSGLIHWQLGLLAGESGDVGGSLVEYRKALGQLSLVRDRESAAVVNALVAAEYLELDDSDRAWEHEARALAALAVSRRNRRDPILTTAATLSATAGFHAGALSFRRPVIEDMTEAGDNVSLAFLLTDDALDLRSLGRSDDALRRIGEARRAADRIGDEGTALLARALQLSAEAAILEDPRPARAAELLGEAIAIYRRRGNDFAVPALAFERGRAFVRAERVDSATAAFGDGIAAVRRAAPGLASDAERSALLSSRWDLYAALADLRIRQGDERGAAALIDRARSGSPVHPRHQTNAYPPAVAAGDAAVEYAVLPSGVHGWVTTRGTRRHFVLAVPAVALGEKIAKYRAAILGGAPEADLRRESGGLFADVLGPASGDIARAGRLILVLDGPLHDLPFASLLDSGNGRYLVERASIVVTPALSTFGRPPSRPSLPAAPALVVGSPDRSSAVSDRLPDLAGARDEAAAVAALYPNAAPAIGPDATREHFMANASRAGLIHFAGHALVNERRPDLSRLLFTPSERYPDGALFAHEIGSMNLSGVRLVVLSACDTARGRIARGVGIVGLARAFLSGSVSSVVATLWPVDDRSSAALFTGFHRAWAEGTDAAEALRETQLAAIRSGARVADWAAPIVVGQAVSR